MHTLLLRDAYSYKDSIHKALKKFKHVVCMEFWGVCLIVVYVYLITNHHVKKNQKLLTAIAHGMTSLILRAVTMVNRK